MIKIPYYFNLDNIINTCEQPVDLNNGLDNSIIKSNPFKPHIDNECTKIKKYQEELEHETKNNFINDNIFNVLDVMKYFNKYQKEKIFKE